GALRLHTGARHCCAPSAALLRAHRIRPRTGRVRRVPRPAAPGTMAIRQQYSRRCDAPSPPGYLRCPASRRLLVRLPTLEGGGTTAPRRRARAQWRWPGPLLPGTVRSRGRAAVETAERRTEGLSQCCRDGRAPARV